MLVDAWPLVGRFVELEACRRALAEDDAPVQLITGAAGVGKSRLMAEICGLLESEREVLRCVTSPGTAPAPLAALAHLLPEDALGPELGGDPARAFHRVLTAFRARTRAPLLSVDDLHLLDSASLALVHQLVSLGLVQLLATLRTASAAPEGVLVIRRLPGCQEQELSPLDEDEVAALLHLHLGLPVDAVLGRQLWDRCQGNPLILLEVVRRAVRQGLIAETGGVLLATGPLPADEHAAGLFLAQVQECSSAGVETLELLACGGSLGLELLESITGSQAIEELERVTLVTVSLSPGRCDVALAHPILGDLLWNRMTVTGRRRVLRTLVARVEASRAFRRDDALRLTGWRLDAGLPVAPAALLAAARLARLAHDAGQVERFARPAQLDAEPGSELEWRAIALLGEALVELTRFAEAEALLSAFQPATAGDLPESIAVIRAANLAEGLVRPQDGLAVILRQEEFGSGTPSPFLRAAHAWHLMVGGDAAAALTMLGADDLSHDPRTIVARAQVAAPCLAVAGRTEEALASCVQAADALASLNDVAALNHRGLHRVNEALALCEAGRLAEAEACAAQVHTEMASETATAARVWAAVTLARVLLVAGRFSAARRWYLEAASLAAAQGLAGAARPALVGLVTACAQLGEVEEAQDRLGELSRLPGSFRFLAPEEALAFGWAAAVAGSYSQAVELLLAGADDAESTGHLTSAAWLLHDAVRIAPQTSRNVSDRLQLLADRSDSELVAARATHVRAVAAGEPEAMLGAAAALQRSGLLVAAAEVLCVAAVRLDRQGEPRRSKAIFAEARALISRLEGARTPGLAPLANTATLTGREREIAGLAAAGVSSKQIANQLVLSTRTVDNHLQRIYHKLGVSSRQSLAAWVALSVQEQS